MNITFLKKDPSKTINWTHGTSSEIFIHPADGDFQTRNFLFRLSTATVEAEETTFTNFGEITRTLMVLKGNLKLIHEGHHTSSLATYEQDTFMGNWPTTSEGMVTDFNLMCKDGAKGTLKHVSGAQGANAIISLHGEFDLLYLVSGAATHQEQSLAPGDSVLIEKGAGNKISVHCNEACDFVHVAVDIQSF